MRHHTLPDALTQDKITLGFERRARRHYERMKTSRTFNSRRVADDQAEANAGYRLNEVVALNKPSILRRSSGGQM